MGKDDKLDMALKGSYAAAKYSVVAILAQSGKVRRHTPGCSWQGLLSSGCVAQQITDGASQLSWLPDRWQRTHQAQSCMALARGTSSEYLGRMAGLRAAQRHPAAASPPPQRQYRLSAAALEERRLKEPAVGAQF